MDSKKTSKVSTPKPSTPKLIFTHRIPTKLINNWDNLNHALEEIYGKAYICEDLWNEVVVTVNVGAPVFLKKTL